ncbi:MAG: Asp-tRNA(Asn)/Glu-tRNA(Gln) amidotransferase subunit GatC [Deltaproteobacteria bacterium]|nr:Asp-tRNA(Asn)/Glu-tRNA(Gln) amidotransferase subunit GatC [Deltaproteobacteria bacterium]
MISKEEVFKIAHLARMAITDAQAEHFSKELSSIFEHIQKLNELDVSDVEPMTHVHGVFNVFREDQVEPSLEIQEVLKNAPDVNGQFFRVPIIKDHDSE